MGARMCRPETVRLEISRGDWLLVKQRLTSGEYRQVLSSVVKPMQVGQVLPEMDPIQATVATVMMYLLDWSITDEHDKPVVILDQPAAVVRSALDNLDIDSFTEIQQAIQTHEVEVAAAAKKPSDGAIASSATLPSAG